MVRPRVKLLYTFWHVSCSVLSESSLVHRLRAASHLQFCCHCKQAFPFSEFYLFRWNPHYGETFWDSKQCHRVRCKKKKKENLRPNLWWAGRGEKEEDQWELKNTKRTLRSINLGFVSCRRDVVTMTSVDNDCSVSGWCLNFKSSLHVVLTFMSFFWFRVSVV